MNNYNLIEKILHDCIFSTKLINKTLFEFEKLLFLHENNIKNNNHVFITGLPRSGTTSILNYLYSTNQFASLKYMHMPFILSPNLSKKIFANKKSIDKERLHSDGIFYNLNSPESFDEVFFSNSTKFIIDELVNYLTLITSVEKKDRYLSKNNLNYKRISLINSILPNAVFFIPIRHPLQHSNSLLYQHSHFLKLQKKNAFIKRYMSYLGHNEFGFNHLSWNKPLKFKDTFQINYWLEQWYLFYEKMYQRFKSFKNCYFIIYDRLEDIQYVKHLTKLVVKKEECKIEESFKISKKKVLLECDTNLLKKSLRLYEKYLVYYQNIK